MSATAAVMVLGGQLFLPRAPREKSLFFEKNSLLALEKFPVPLLGEFVRKPLNQLKN
jgi:hypothetical protein